jgi:hypothetical protein
MDGGFARRSVETSPQLFAIQGNNLPAGARFHRARPRGQAAGKGLWVQAGQDAPEGVVARDAALEF